MTQEQSGLGVLVPWHTRSECYLQTCILFPKTSAVSLANFSYVKEENWWTQLPRQTECGHAVPGSCRNSDHTSIEPYNTSCYPSWASPEKRQQLCVKVFRCKQMFMGDWHNQPSHFTYGLHQIGMKGNHAHSFTLSKCFQNSGNFLFSFSDMNIQYI